MLKNNKNENKTNYFANIKSKYILKKIFENIKYVKLLNIIIKNKNIQNRIGIGLKDYIKYYGKIEIEIIPIHDLDDEEEKYNFINIKIKEDKPYYHIYFNNNSNESKKTFLMDVNALKKLILLNLIDMI